MTTHKGLPVHGYREQTSDKVDMVNHNKMIEESILQGMDACQGNPDIDQRWLAIARTQMEDVVLHDGDAKLPTVILCGGDAGQARK